MEENVSLSLTVYYVVCFWSLDSHSAIAVDQHLNEDNGFWEIQNPSAFYTFTIPFEMEGDTQVHLHLLLLEFTCHCCL